MGRLSATSKGQTQPMYVSTNFGMLQVYQGQETLTGTWNYRLPFHIERSGGSGLESHKIQKLIVPRDFFTLALSEKYLFLFDVLYHCRVPELFEQRTFKKRKWEDKLTPLSAASRMFQQMTDEAKQGLFLSVFSLGTKPGIASNLSEGRHGLDRFIIGQVIQQRALERYFVDNELGIRHMSLVYAGQSTLIAVYKALSNIPKPMGLATTDVIQPDSVFVNIIVLFDCSNIE